MFFAFNSLSQLQNKTEFFNPMSNTFQIRIIINIIPRFFSNPQFLEELFFSLAGQELLEGVVKIYTFVPPKTHCAISCLRFATLRNKFVFIQAAV